MAQMDTTQNISFHFIYFVRRLISGGTKKNLLQTRISDSGKRIPELKRNPPMHSISLDETEVLFQQKDELLLSHFLRPLLSRQSTPYAMLSQATSSIASKRNLKRKTKRTTRFFFIYVQPPNHPSFVPSCTPW
mmetsp:Transcript_20027/g.55701  ORF Transcript_20027/g.55701 Transcript_20027/m.55701 type:complete len:133 (-) Transcript_20027:769-1167(-)